MAIGKAVPDPSEPSKLNVTFEYGPIKIYANYWVIETDYNTYSLVYSCNNLPNGEINEIAWVLSRAQTLDPGIFADLLARLVISGVDPTLIEKFEEVIQDC
jgi:apolipoprotein D and lipocalin family protein